MEQSFGFFGKVQKTVPNYALIFCILEERFRGGGGGDQNCRTDFDISVIRPVFHR